MHEVGRKNSRLKLSVSAFESNKSFRAEQSSRPFEIVFPRSSTLIWEHKARSFDSFFLKFAQFVCSRVVKADEIRCIIVSTCYRFDSIHKSEI